MLRAIHEALMKVLCKAPKLVASDNAHTPKSQPSPSNPRTETLSALLPGPLYSRLPPLFDRHRNVG